MPAAHGKHAGELAAPEKVPAAHTKQLVAFANEPAAHEHTSAPPDPRPEKPDVHAQVDGVLAAEPALDVLLPGHERQLLRVEL